jgi:bifunctional DNase/RNase
MKEVRLTVQSVLSDPKTDTQIVILRDDGNTEMLPIWVGVVEGNAIRFALEGIIPPRPMTHDLLKELFDHLNIQPLKVVVNEIKNNTYYAALHLLVKDKLHIVDSRPSDAIALALRTNIPIFALDDVLKEKSSDNLDAWLQKLHPKDFGKFNA